MQRVDDGITVVPLEIMSEDVHDTVIVFYFFDIVDDTRSHMLFFFRCYGCGRATRETLGFDVITPLQKQPGGISAYTMSTVARFV